MCHLLITQRFNYHIRCLFASAATLACLFLLCTRACVCAFLFILFFYSFFCDLVDVCQSIWADYCARLSCWHCAYTTLFLQHGNVHMTPFCIYVYIYFSFSSSSSFFNRVTIYACKCNWELCAESLVSSYAKLFAAWRCLNLCFWLSFFCLFFYLFSFSLVKKRSTDKLFLVHTAAIIACDVFCCVVVSLYLICAHVYLCVYILSCY